MFRTRFCAGDLLVLLSLGLVAVLLGLSFFLPRGGSNTAELLLVSTPAGEAVYPLSTDRELTLQGNGITLTVSISGGQARVTETNCPDEICRLSGQISRAGETVVCAPAGIRLTVTDREGGGGGDADAIVG